MNPQHAIVAGLGPRPADSVGNPWSGVYIIASGNLLADFRANLNAESQGRLQVARIYEMIDDRGVKGLLSVLLARDSYHQNLWAQAVKELEEKEGTILVPSTFPRNEERLDIAYDFIISLKEIKVKKALGQKEKHLMVKVNTNGFLHLKLKAKRQN